MILSSSSSSFNLLEDDIGQLFARIILLSCFIIGKRERERERERGEFVVYSK